MTEPERRNTLDATQTLLERASLVARPLTIHSGQFTGIESKTSIAVAIGITSVLAIIASITGIAAPKANIYLISDDTLIAVFLYFAAMITINERLVETYRATYRDSGKQTLCQRLKYYLNFTDDNPKQRNGDKLAETKDLDGLVLSEDEKQSQINLIQVQALKLKIYTTVTRRHTLLLSFVIGFILSATGMARVLYYFVDEDQYSQPWVVVAVDIVDILFCAFLMAGGSKGWNVVVGTITDLIKKK